MATVVQTVIAYVLNDVTLTANIAPAQAGNMLVAVMSSNRAVSNIGQPSGFTEKCRITNGTGGNFVSGVKLANGGETQVTMTATIGSSRMLMTVFELAGVETNIANIVASTSTGVGVSAYTTPSITGEGFFITGLTIGAGAPNPVAWSGWDNGFTTASEHNSTAGSNNIAQSTGYKNVTPSTATSSTQGWNASLNVAGGILYFPGVVDGGGTQEYTHYRLMNNVWVPQEVTRL